MIAYVSEAEWLGLPPATQANVVEMLIEQRLLQQGEEIQVSPWLPRLVEIGTPSLRHPGIAEACNGVAGDGMVPVSILQCAHFGPQQNAVCSVVLYAPSPGAAPTTI